MDVTIVDAIFFLHLHLNLPLAFGGLATHLLAKVLELDGFAVHFTFDKWASPSIKECKRRSRSVESGSILYEIKGASQKCPSNWLSALRSSTFKESLMYFLVEFWSNDKLAYLFNSKILYVNCNDKCYQCYANNNQAVCQEVHALYSKHEEADSCMFFHLKSIDPPLNLSIRTANNDCLIIALACRLNHDNQIKVWMEVGTHTSNNICYINIDELHSHFGKNHTAKSSHQKISKLEKNEGSKILSFLEKYDRCMFQGPDIKKIRA